MCEQRRRSLHLDCTSSALPPLPIGLGTCSWPTAASAVHIESTSRARSALQALALTMDASSSSSSSAGAGGAQAAWQHFQQQRLEDLHAAYALAQQALLTQRLPKDVPPNVAYTAMGAVALSGLLLVLLHPKGRRLILDVGETVLATILVLLLLVIVLGLPFGAIFIAYKGIAFVITSLLQYYPQAQEALDGLNKTVRASWG